MKLNLEYIRTLSTVVDEGGFAAAARCLNKAQSAVTYDIKQLEAGLGVPLFDRSGYRAELTDAGRAVLAEGRFLLERARRIEAMADRFAEGYEPGLKVIIDGILPMEPIMRGLKRLAEEGNPTRISVKMEFLGGVQHRFEQEHADIMLVKEYRPHPTLAAGRLPDVECVLVAAPDFDLFRDHPQEEVGLSVLQEYQELSIHDSSESDIAVNIHGFGGSKVFYMSDFYTKREGLRMGLGFGWLPRYLVDEDLATGGLVEIRCETGSRFSFTPHLVHPVTRPLGKTGRRLLSMLQEGLA